MTEEGMGFFSTKLADAMERLPISARALAADVDCSYEHIRKLVVAKALPSNGLLKALCRLFKWKYGDMRELVLVDHCRLLCGASFWHAQGKDPRVEPFYILGPYLTDEQHSFIVESARRLAAVNKGRKRQRLSG